MAERFTALCDRCKKEIIPIAGGIHSIQSLPIAMERGNDPETYIMVLRSMMEHVYALARVGDVDFSKVVGGTLEIEIEKWDKTFTLVLELEDDE